MPVSEDLQNMAVETLKWAAFWLSMTFVLTMEVNLQPAKPPCEIIPFPKFRKAQRKTGYEGAESIIEGQP